MDFLRPGSLDEALALKEQHPAAVPIAGGTDIMVEINFDQRRPAALLDLTRVTELTNWAKNGVGWLRIGAGVSYTRLIGELGSLLPGLAMAARTVGSPQIRNRGTIGGNLGAASPAGDCHPVLLAAGAEIEVASARGTRLIPVAEFFTGPKRNALEPDELITAVLLPVAPGPQQFAKIGTRNAMVIAVCAFALELRPGSQNGRVGTGIGSAGPTPLRAVDAEEFLAARLPWGETGALPEPLVREFGDLVAAAARPIDDVRGTAAYRRHALSVLARRTLTWAWEEQACA
ncbi:MAG TPA: xanthine dehydrogenase family protein subunit M [Streptosporangiaceae bacterium]|nr:xanthine dehydrogenase family protein subunit M [Streptosporangiaceae bacterium]